MILPPILRPMTAESLYWFLRQYLENQDKCTVPHAFLGWYWNYKEGCWCLRGNGQTVPMWLCSKGRWPCSRHKFDRCEWVWTPWGGPGPCNVRTHNCSNNGPLFIKSKADIKKISDGLMRWRTLKIELDISQKNPVASSRGGWHMVRAKDAN